MRVTRSDAISSLGVTLVPPDESPRAPAASLLAPAPTPDPDQDDGGNEDEDEDKDGGDVREGMPKLASARAVDKPPRTVVAMVLLSTSTALWAQ
jgi:hypothetical protein